MIEGVILGSGATKPSADRNPSGIHLKADGVSILLDCGEGTQRQLLKYGCDFFTDYVVLSHHHSDHTGGLAPYLQSMSLLNRTKKIVIYSPDPKKVHAMLTGIKLNYEVEVRTTLLQVDYLHQGIVFRFYRASHGDIPAVSTLLRSAKTVRRDRDKLLSLPLAVRKTMCNQGSAVHQGATLQLKDYTLPAEPRFEVYYSGDTMWSDATPTRTHPKGMVIHECTYLQPDDYIESRKRHHTHYKDIALPQDHILTHVSEKVPIKQIPGKYPLASNGVWATDGLRFHNKIW